MCRNTIKLKSIEPACIFYTVFWRLSINNMTSDFGGNGSKKQIVTRGCRPDADVCLKNNDLYFQ